jgi:hypothetical protein
MTMKPRVRWMLTLAVVAALAVVARPVAADGGTRAGDVKVTVKYTGKGTVDASHRLWIWLFDTPEIGPGAVPVAEMALEKNGTTATFSNIASGKVWIAIAFDEAGGFAGAGPPPTGAPVTLYAEKGLPTPVVPGPKAEVTVTFDDSQRMQ